MMFLRRRALRRGARLARRTADRALLRFVNGLALVMDEAMTPIGDTPKERILHDGKLEVFRYLPRKDEVDDDAATRTGRFPVPIVLVHR